MAVRFFGRLLERERDPIIAPALNESLNELADGDDQDLRGIPHMTSKHKGGLGGQELLQTFVDKQYRTITIDYANEEGRRGRVSKNPKIVWTSYMESPKCEKRVPSFLPSIHSAKEELLLFLLLVIPLLP